MSTEGEDTQMGLKTYIKRAEQSLVTLESMEMMGMQRAVVMLRICQQQL